ncbi:CHAT domain-containing protein [Humibacillus xanthopallidus]
MLRTSQYVAAKRQRGLRLRIRFSDATALANLPWELLYDPERHWYPCQLSRFPTIRFVDLPEPVQPLRVTGPLRMLVVISSPTDLPPLEVEREWSLLQAELDPLVRSGRLELERLPLASLEDVRETLMTRDFHIFHYIGHGGVDDDTGEGQLAFTGPDGRQRRVTGSQLGVMLSNAPIRLAVLNSCEGGRVSDVDPYASTAIALVEQGIPAVVAMQFQITDAAATAFSRTLYDSVTAGRPVDLAVTLARQAVLAASEAEWATPVLYLRAVDGVLFDLEHRDEPAAAAPPPEPRSVPVPAPEPAVRVAAPVAAEPAVPAQPRHLRAEVVDGVVNLLWQQPTEHAMPARAWEVWRNGIRQAIVRLPMALDDTPGPGEYHYTVVALGDGETRSPHSHTCTTYVTKPVRRTAPAAMPPPRTAPVPVRQALQPPVQPTRRKSRAGWILLVLALVVGFGAWSLLRPGTTPSGTGVVTPPSVGTDGNGADDGSAAPAKADLSVSTPGPESYSRTEVQFTFTIANHGPGDATGETVTVTVEGGGTGALLAAQVEPPGESQRSCDPGGSADTATCRIDTHLAESEATVVVVVLQGDGTTTVTVEARSDVEDSNPDDNSTTVRTM